MGNILIINTGSTSVKYRLFDESEKELLQGEVENVKDYEQAIKSLLRQVINLGDIVAVGHRVVHGGGKFFDPVVINEKNLSELESFNYLAPLHNPYNIAGIKATASFLPEVPQVAVFDTAFYKNLPEVARHYALPNKISQQYGFVRYGFHGTSHEYAMHEAALKLKKNVKKINLISCHLGGGASVAAIKNGQAIDISNGYTPTEGIVMMTRTGDLDPSIIIELIKLLPGEINAEKVEQVYNLINHDSGIKGLTGGIIDFQELIKLVSLGQSEATAAFDIFIYRLLKYIGSYWTVLEGKVDAIIFTGSIGSGNPITRNKVMGKLRHLGKVPALSIETNEEMMIARKLTALLKR